MNILRLGKNVLGAVAGAIVDDDDFPIMHGDCSVILYTSTRVRDSVLFVVRRGDNGKRRKDVTIALGIGWSEFVQFAGLSALMFYFHINLSSFAGLHIICLSRAPKRSPQPRTTDPASSTGAHWVFAQAHAKMCVR